MLKTICLTSDIGNKWVQGFQFQWRKYCKMDCTVYGFSKPEKYDEGFPFVSIGKFEDYPVGLYSNGLIKCLEMIEDDHVIISLEDYWMMRNVNTSGIQSAHYFMQNNPKVVRFDLTTDRLYTDPFRDIGSMDVFDIIESGKNNQYNLSLQASMWDRKLLLSLLQPYESPWEVELEGTHRLNSSDLRVVGTRQWLMKYHIVVNKGRLDTKGQWQYPPRSLKYEDWLDLEALYESKFVSM